MKYLAIVLIFLGSAIGQNPICAPGFQGNNGCLVDSTKQPEAKPTDGIEPTYTVEPVTQKVPHCKRGMKLMQFDPAYSPINFGVPQEGDYPHPAEWVDSATPNADITFGMFRCFPETKQAKEDLKNYDPCGGCLGKGDCISHCQRIVCPDPTNDESCHLEDSAVVQGDNSIKLAEDQFLMSVGGKVHLQYLDIPLDIKYCDQVSGKDAGAECVQRAELVSPQVKYGLIIKYKPSEIKPGASCPSGMHWQQGNYTNDYVQNASKANPRASIIVGPTHYGDWKISDDDYYFCERNAK